jgi:hypothetical protein
MVSLTVDIDDASVDRVLLALCTYAGFTEELDLTPENAQLAVVDILKTQVLMQERLAAYYLVQGSPPPDIS